MATKQATKHLISPCSSVSLALLEAESELAVDDSDEDERLEVGGRYRSLGEDSPGMFGVSILGFVADFAHDGNPLRYIHSPGHAACKFQDYQNHNLQQFPGYICDRPNPLIRLYYLVDFWSQCHFVELRRLLRRNK